MSEGIFIEGARNTPSIHWNKEKSSLDFIGKSFPENSRKFYNPVLDWINTYDFDKEQELEFNFSLEYISSSTVLSLLEIMHALDRMYKEDYKIKIIWGYDQGDYDIRSIGESYSNLISVPFEYFENAD